MKLLKQADYSAETDLKERLRQQLFGGAGNIRPLRRELADDEAEQVHAAGDAASFGCKPQEQEDPFAGLHRP